MHKARRKAPTPPPPSPEEIAFRDWARHHNETLERWLDRLEDWAGPIVAEYRELIARDTRRAVARAATGSPPANGWIAPSGRRILARCGPVAVAVLQHARRIREAADPMDAAHAGYELGLAVQRLSIEAAEAVVEATATQRHAGTVFLHGHAFPVPPKLEAWFKVFQGDVIAVDTAEVARRTLGRIDYRQATDELRAVRDHANKHLAKHGVPLRIRVDLANGSHVVEERQADDCGT